MEKKPFVTKEQLEEIVKKYPTPFHLYDEKGIRVYADGMKVHTSLCGDYQVENLKTALAAARGFVLALTVAVGIGQGEGVLLSLCSAGLPAVLSVSALLAACAMVWQSREAAGRYALRACRTPYLLCVALAALSALLRAGMAALWNL